MSRPRLSVVVPVYKTEPYLRRCLDSILSQDFEQMEVICINDGSPGAAADILAEYAAKDSRLIVIHQANEGQAAARMAGLRVAQGEWISLVDSDDFLEPGIYRKAMQYAAPDVDVVCFASRIVEEGSKAPSNLEDYLKFPKKGKVTVTPEDIRLTNVMAWNKLWRRRIIERHGIPMPVNHIHEDYVFYYAYMAMARNMYVMEEIGYNYVIRPDSLTRSYEEYSVENIISYSHSWNYILEFYAGHGRLTALAEMVLEILKYYFGVCEKLTAEADRRKAVSAFKSLLVKYRILELYLSPLQKEDTRLWWCYKLSFGKRRKARKEEHRKHHCYLQALQSSLKSFEESLDGDS